MPLRRALATAVAVLACLSLAPAASAANPLKLVSRERLADRLYELTFTTPALSAPTKVRLLLPAGYDAKASRRYPVLLLLHGAGGSYSDWTTAGEARDITRYLPVIVVMPDGGRGGWYSDWYNGGAFGPPRWETYHLRQLVPWIESRYRAVGERRGRAVAGLSMGGFGTMSYASRHPDMFSSAAAFSGAVDANVPPGIGEPIVNATSSQDGGKPGDVIGTRAENEVRWRGHNPWDLASNLRGVDVTLRTGDGSPGGPYDTGTTPDVIEQIVHTENLSFHKRLGELGIAHVFQDYGPGFHRWPYWSRALRQTLPGILARFKKPRPPRNPLTYRSIEPSYSVWGFDVAVQRKALEFSSLRIAGRRGFSLSGSGSASVATPAVYRPGATYRVVATSAQSGTRRLDLRARRGRLRIPVRLGPSNATQEQFTRGRPAHGRHPRLHHHGEDQALGLISGRSSLFTLPISSVGLDEIRDRRIRLTPRSRTSPRGRAWRTPRRPPSSACARSPAGAAGPPPPPRRAAPGSATRTMATKSHSPVTE